MNDATPADIERVLAALAQGPARITSMLDGVDASLLAISPDAASWSVAENLAHLRACADVWGAGIARMLSEDQPTIKYVSPRTWIRKTDYCRQDCQALLAAYDRQRRELVASLAALPSQGWSRTGTFTRTTRGRDQTVYSYALRIAEHEGRHLLQIEGVLSALGASERHVSDVAEASRGVQTC
jgi:hypothetical protein